MIKLVKNKDHDVIKRDGSIEPYQQEKLWKVVLWACDGKEDAAKILMESIDIKIYNKIPIQTLFDEAISTAANLINPIQPFWDDVAKKLLLLKYYKEVWNLKKTGEYPDIRKVIDIGLNAGIYNQKVYDSFTEDELDQINSFIKPDNDFLFNFSGLFFHNNKYCHKDHEKVQFELPQFSYMRMAMYAFWKENRDERMQLIKDHYEDISSFNETAGTPRVINSGTYNSQLASCVLNTVDDSTYSINETNKNIGVYSKFGGGIAIDITKLRASGAAVKGNRGYSSGPVPFVKEFESTISAFNQGGTRKGSAVVSFPFWHLDVSDLLVLKDAGGAEDNRARKLQYAFKHYPLFKERVREDDYITLFDPVEVPDLIEAYGEEFGIVYRRYERTPGLRKKRVKARDLAFEFIKNRTETGNLYVSFMDNINRQNSMKWHVGASNLCQEITVRSTPSQHVSNDANEVNGTAFYNELKETGEIGLCNLSSINLVRFRQMSLEEKHRFIYTSLRAHDNLIESQYYPVIEGEHSNKRNRPIGVGVSNATNAMALEGIGINDEAAKQWTHEVFEELSYIILWESSKLAEERGAFTTFSQSRWADGEVPLDWSILANEYQDRTDLNFPLLKDWPALRNRIKEFGVRFSLHMAIAPTATSGKVIGATESIEPIHDIFSVQEGTITLPTLAPNIKENRQHYVRAFDTNPRHLIELAAIRQKFLDQSQSVNLYYKKPGSAKELIQDIFYAEDLGVKTLYYMKTPKANYDDACEGCSS